MSSLQSHNVLLLMSIAKVLLSYIILSVMVDECGRLLAPPTLHSQPAFRGGVHPTFHANVCLPAHAAPGCHERPSLLTMAPAV